MHLSRTLLILDDTIILGEAGVYRLFEIELEQACALIDMYRDSNNIVKSAVRTEEAAKAMSVFLGFELPVGDGAAIQTTVSEALCYRDGAWFVLRLEEFGHAEEHGARKALAEMQDALLNAMRRVSSYAMTPNLPSVPSR
jgi:hypothetical protein